MHLPKPRSKLALFNTTASSISYLTQHTHTHDKSMRPWVQDHNDTASIIGMRSHDNGTPALLSFCFRFLSSLLFVPRITHNGNCSILPTRNFLKANHLNRPCFRHRLLRIHL